MKDGMKELQKLKGVGEVLSRRFVEAGYDTFAKIAIANPGRDYTPNDLVAIGRLADENLELVDYGEGDEEDVGAVHGAAGSLVRGARAPPRPQVVRGAPTGKQRARTDRGCGLEVLEARVAVERDHRRRRERHVAVLAVGGGLVGSVGERLRGSLNRSVDDGFRDSRRLGAARL